MIAFFERAGPTIGLPFSHIIQSPFFILRSSSAWQLRNRLHLKTVLFLTNRNPFRKVEPECLAWLNWDKILEGKSLFSKMILTVRAALSPWTLPGRTTLEFKGITSPRDAKILLIDCLPWAICWETSKSNYQNLNPMCYLPHLMYCGHMSSSLFSIFINCLNEALHHYHFLPFADDIKLLCKFTPWITVVYLKVILKVL